MKKDLFSAKQKTPDKNAWKSLKPYSKTIVKEQHKLCLIHSSTDYGVMRNSGRNGTKHAPAAIMAQLGKLQIHNESSIVYHEVASEKLEKENFEHAQKIEAQNILELLDTLNAEHFVHLGGGHDHAYPFLQAMAQKHKTHCVILNIDAHCDTRKSEFAHSGTPFRQYLDEDNKSELFQYGIHEFANSESTLADMPRMKIFSFHKIKKDSQGFRCLPVELLKQVEEQLPSECIFFLSIDADAIKSDVMEGVSAPNHNGIPMDHLYDLVDWFKNLKHKKKLTGIYEYNPVYDPSTKGARALAALIYKFLS